MDEFFTRALIVKERVDRLADEAQASDDRARVRAIREEIELLLSNLRDIREEQLISTLPKPEPPKPRRRWQFWKPVESVQGKGG